METVRHSRRSDSHRQPDRVFAAKASRALINDVFVFNFSLTIEGRIKTSVQAQGVPFSFKLLRESLSLFP